MQVLITGSAGFIGFHVTLKLLKLNFRVFGVDNLNNYYSKKLKVDRLFQLIKNKNYKHFNFNIDNKNKIDEIFKKSRIDYVIHLAAQAGVRYSLKNPRIYIQSNINGFLNILEASSRYKVKHLIYASSSSVYGANNKIPYSVKDSTNHPISLYAATKKSNELMAHAYSSLYALPTTGLRFFTVYGPWGRPDMALFKFTTNILKKKSIDIFNYGNHLRDFTYIDDAVNAVIKVIKKIPKGNKNWYKRNLPKESSYCPWKIYNVGNNKPIKLIKYIQELEKNLNLKAKKKFLPLQKGDVLKTFADIRISKKDFNYNPRTDYKKGINYFVKWFLEYYKY